MDVVVGNTCSLKGINVFKYKKYPSQKKLRAEYYEKYSPESPKGGYIFKTFWGQPPNPPMLYVPNRENGAFTVIYDSERCVL